MKKGKVYLVGAGPGDPELITQRGAALLRKADCLLYDRLIPKKLLQLAKPGCEKIDVGKLPDEGGRSQKTINRLLAAKARRHRMVVRLKGGDPMLFGRASEELGILSRARIPFEIVPGVSSVWAAAAAAGIPLTDRRYSSSVALVTGQEASGKKSRVDWKKLSRSVDTLVILMGRSALPAIARKLMASGKSASTPVALIRWATTPQEEILVGTLGTIDERLRAKPHFGPPVVAIVGEVVKRRLEFHAAPLSGKRVLITRPISDSRSLASRLMALGATCVKLPTIAIRPRKLSREESLELLKKLPAYDWILFASHHGVDTLAALAQRLKKPLPRIVRARICAIGPRTAISVKENGLKVDLVPQEFSTRGIRKAFRSISLSRKRILIPRSNLGMRDALSRELRRRGAQVDEVTLYETVELSPSPKKIREALKGLDAVTFTSASTVRSFVKALKRAGRRPAEAFNGTAIVAIGPQTGQALQESGISKFFLPKESWTVDGLIQAVTGALR